jgi:hypothetical protein
VSDPTELGPTLSRSRINRSSSEAVLLLLLLVSLVDAVNGTDDDTLGEEDISDVVLSFSV